MKINALSASGYGTWEWCSWKYFLQYELGFEDISGAAAFMGTLGHKVLELLSKAVVVNHPKDSKIWDVQHLWNICFNYYYLKEPVIAEQVEPSKLKKVCEGIHNLLASHYSPIRDNTISAEVGFNFSLEEPDFKLPDSDQYFSIRGRIDRVDKIDDETIEIIDYKTGSRVCWESEDRHKKGPEDLRKEIQPRMYHLAAKHLYPWAKNIIVTFIYIVDGGPVSVLFVDEDAEDTKEMIRKRFKTIQNSNNPNRSLGWKCNMCNFKKDGSCDTTWEAKNEFGIDHVKENYTVVRIKHR
jgi:hypothetical protein